MNGFVPVNEVELSQREDPIAIERGLEGEVEAGKRLHRVIRAVMRAIFTRRFWRSVSSSVEQGVDRIQRRDLAALDLAHGLDPAPQGRAPS